MAKYQPTKTEQRRLIAKLLWETQGKRCKICKKAKTLKQGITEHANGDRSDYRPENIGWVCHSCNQRKRPDFVQQDRNTTGKSVCVKLSDSEKHRRRNRIKKAPIEIEINQDSEPKVRRYLWENVGRDGGLILEDARDEAAEESDCSPVTAGRHIGKACSLKGPFRIMLVNDITKGPIEVIILRDGYVPKLDRRLGRLDAQIMQERIAAAELAIRAKESQNTDMQKSLQRVCLDRDYLIAKLAEKTGKSVEEIYKELEKKK